MKDETVRGILAFMTVGVCVVLGGCQFFGIGIDANETEVGSLTGALMAYSAQVMNYYFKKNNDKGVKF